MEDRGARRAAVHGVTKSGTRLATEWQQQTASTRSLLGRQSVRFGSTDSEAAFPQASQVLFCPSKLKRHCCGVFTALLRSRGQRQGGACEGGGGDWSCEVMAKPAGPLGMRDLGQLELGVWGLRKAQIIASDSNFPHIRIKGENHLNGLNLGCLTS